MKVKDILFPVPKLLKQKTGVAQNKEATVDLGVLGIKIGTEKNTGETSAVKLKEVIEQFTADDVKKGAKFETQLGPKLTYDVLSDLDENGKIRVMVTHRWHHDQYERDFTTARFLEEINERRAKKVRAGVTEGAFVFDGHKV